MYDYDALHRYCKAGQAVVIVKSKKTGQVFKFVLKRSDHRTFPAHKKPNLFVSVLGDRNKPLYIGHIPLWTGKEAFKYSYKRGKIPRTDVRVQGFAWFWQHLLCRSLKDVEITLGKRCARCGKMLTTEESLKIGLGPTCRRAVLG